MKAKSKYFLLSIAVMLGMGSMSVSDAGAPTFSIYINNNTNDLIDVKFGSFNLGRAGEYWSPATYNIQPGESKYMQWTQRTGTGRMQMYAWVKGSGGTNGQEVPGAYLSGHGVANGGDYQFSIGCKANSGCASYDDYVGSAQSYP